MHLPFRNLQHCVDAPVFLLLANGMAYFEGFGSGSLRVWEYVEAAYGE